MNYSEEELLEKLDAKTDRAVTNTVISYGIAAVGVFATAILGLYILYYSGLSDIKVDVATIKANISQIDKTLNLAEIQP